MPLPTAFQPDFSPSNPHADHPTDPPTDHFQRPANALPSNPPYPPRVGRPLRAASNVSKNRRVDVGADVRRDARVR